MKYSDLQLEELGSRKVFIIAFYTSTFIMLSICSFALYESAGEYLKTGTIVIGDVLVKTEFPIKGSPSLVTYLMITSIYSWFCVTRLAGEKVSAISGPVRSLCQLFALAIAMIALYEFVYNFVLWNSLFIDEVVRGEFQSEGISIAYPNPGTPWNLMFATKMTLAAFLISAHAFYLITKTKKPV
jgi:hypothetical protein